MPAALPERHLRRRHVRVHRPRPVPDGVHQLQRQLVVAAFRVGLLLVPVRGAVLLYAGQGHGVAPDVMGSCSSTLVLPCSSMADSLAAGNSTFGDVIRGGFAVRWKAGAGWCGDCRNSGGFCGYNSSSPTDHTCFCPDGTSIGSCSSGMFCPRNPTSSKSRIV